MRPRPLTFALLLVSGTWWISGCGPSAPPFVVKPGSYQLSYATINEIQASITPGSITVVDYWSLSCAPCLKELPELAELSRRSGDKIRCIGVSVDYEGRQSRPATMYEPVIRAVLDGIGATFSNYICTTESDDVFRSLDLPSLPAVIVYDARGKMLRKFVDAGDTRGFSYAKDIVPFLDTLTRTDDAGS